MTDGERFAEAVSPLVPQMLRAAVALLGPVDGEDAAQEAITRAWQARAALRDQDALRPWLQCARRDSRSLALHLHWSLWRRQHQWQARQAHSRRRALSLAMASLPEVSCELPDPLTIASLPR